MIPTSLVGLFTWHDRFTSYLRSKFERITSPHRKEVELLAKVKPRTFLSRLGGGSIVQRLGDLGRPIPVWMDSLISWELHEPLPSQNKETQLIAILSVLSIKFHYLHLGHHWRWILAWGNHRSLDDFSSHLFVFCMNCPNTSMLSVIDTCLLIFNTLLGEYFWWPYIGVGKTCLTCTSLILWCHPVLS